MDKDNINNTVNRISVDEWLSEDLLRLEICELIKHDESGEFRDEPEFWRDITEEGKEIITRPANSEYDNSLRVYTELMSIPESQVKNYLWKNLEEGQVFLSGAFEIVKENNGENTIRRYFYRPGEKRFAQIDDDVKKNTKALYYEVLAKGDRNG